MRDPHPARDSAGIRGVDGHNRRRPVLHDERAGARDHRSRAPARVPSRAGDHLAAVRSYTVVPPTVFAVKLAFTQAAICAASSEPDVAWPMPTEPLPMK